MRSILVPITVAALGCVLAGCSSSSGGKAAASQAASSQAQQAQSAPPTSTPARTDESARFDGLLDLVDNGARVPGQAGKTVRFDSSGLVAADGQFAVTEDAAATTICLTDTSAAVSMQMRKAQTEKFDFFRASDCAHEIGTISADANGKAQPSSDDPTLQGLAKKIDQLGS